MGKAGKTERGRQTRARVVGAATTLFCEQGYLNTTMAAIAGAADVAVQTLYLAFGSKVAILTAAHDTAVVGDDEQTALLDRAWATDVRDDLDGPRALRMVMANTLAVVDRVGPLYDVIQTAAADAEVGELLARIKAQRLATMRALAAELATKDGFVPALSADEAADVLYAVVSNELHRILVIERHWPMEAWERWAYESAAFRLFPHAALDRGKQRRSAPRHVGRQPA
jgi:AcrR family transcriptional regulator